MITFKRFIENILRGILIFAYPLAIAYLAYLAIIVILAGPLELPPNVHAYAEYAVYFVLVGFIRGLFDLYE